MAQSSAAAGGGGGVGGRGAPGKAGQDSILDSLALLADTVSESQQSGAGEARSPLSPRSPTKVGWTDVDAKAVGGAGAAGAGELKLEPRSPPLPPASMLPRGALPIGRGVVVSRNGKGPRTASVPIGYRFPSPRPPAPTSAPMPASPAAEPMQGVYLVLPNGEPPPDLPGYGKPIIVGHVPISPDDTDAPSKIPSAKTALPATSAAAATSTPSLPTPTPPTHPTTSTTTTSSPPLPSFPTPSFPSRSLPPPTTSLPLSSLPPSSLPSTLTPTPHFATTTAPSIPPVASSHPSTPSLPPQSHPHHPHLPYHPPHAVPMSAGMQYDRRMVGAGGAGMVMGGGGGYGVGRGMVVGGMGMVGYGGQQATHAPFHPAFMRSPYPIPYPYPPPPPSASHPTPTPLPHPHPHPQMIPVDGGRMMMGSMGSFPGYVWNSQRGTYPVLVAPPPPPGTLGGGVGGGGGGGGVGGVGGVLGGLGVVDGVRKGGMGRGMGVMVASQPKRRGGGVGSRGGVGGKVLKRDLSYLDDLGGVSMSGRKRRPKHDEDFVFEEVRSGGGVLGAGEFPFYHPLQGAMTRYGGEHPMVQPPQAHNGLSPAERAQHLVASRRGRPRLVDLERKVFFFHWENLERIRDGPFRAAFPDKSSIPLQRAPGMPPSERRSASVPRSLQSVEAKIDRLAQQAKLEAEKRIANPPKPAYSFPPPTATSPSAASSSSSSSSSASPTHGVSRDEVDVGVDDDDEGDDGDDEGGSSSSSISPSPSPSSASASAAASAAASAPLASSSAAAHPSSSSSSSSSPPPPQSHPSPTPSSSSRTIISLSLRKKDTESGEVVDGDENTATTPPETPSLPVSTSPIAPPTTTSSASSDPQLASSSAAAAAIVAGGVAGGVAEGEGGVVEEKESGMGEEQLEEEGKGIRMTRRGARVIPLDPGGIRMPPPPPQICPDCGEQFPKRVELRTHREIVHGKERQPRIGGRGHRRWGRRRVGERPPPPKTKAQLREEGEEGDVGGEDVEEEGSEKEEGEEEEGEEEEHGEGRVELRRVGVGEVEFDSDASTIEGDGFGDDDEVDTEV